MVKSFQNLCGVGLYERGNPLNCWNGTSTAFRNLDRRCECRFFDVNIYFSSWIYMFSHPVCLSLTTHNAFIRLIMLSGFQVQELSVRPWDDLVCFTVSFQRLCAILLIRVQFSWVNKWSGLERCSVVYVVFILRAAGMCSVLFIFPCVCLKVMQSSTFSLFSP